MTAKSYNQMVKDQTGWRGAYPLIVSMKVGDFFQFDSQGVPVGLGNVLNWPKWAQRLVVEPGEPRGKESWYGACERKAGASASGGVTTPYGLGADASISLSFSRDGGFALSYDEAQVSRFQDVPVAQRDVLAAIRAGWWDPQWVLITHVISTTSASLVVSTGASSSIELHANASIPDIGNVQISDPALGWSASSWIGSGYTSLCRAGTPLYRCTKIKRSWLGRLKVEELGPAADLEEVFGDGDDIFDES